MLGALILFLGWELRKERREIQKLDLEIAQMRSQQSLVRVATIHEMNSLIKDVEEISARKLGILGGPSPLEDFAIRFREFLVLTVCGAVTRRVFRGNSFALIVKWSGLIYDIRDNSPNERTSASLY
jgi:hypothetical protein